MRILGLLAAGGSADLETRRLCEVCAEVTAYAKATASETGLLKIGGHTLTIAQGLDRRARTANGTAAYVAAAPSRCFFFWAANHSKR